MKSRPETAVIIGIVQIGGSLGLALKNANFFGKIGGFDLDTKRLKLADGFLDFCCYDLDDALRKSDIVILAVPVFEIVRILEHGINKYSQKFYTDVGSCKIPMFEISGNSQKVRYIGGHPLAGTEKKGEKGWDASLFNNKPYFYVIDKNQSAQDEEMLIDMIKSIGAIPCSISASEHDRSVALTSHLPLFASLALMGRYSDQDQNMKTFVGSGFRSMTRLSGCSPQMGKDMLISNRKNILSELDKYICELDSLAEHLKNSDDDVLLEKMLKYHKLYWQFINDKNHT